jgi:hypothetical protein
MTHHRRLRHTRTLAAMAVALVAGVAASLPVGLAASQPAGAATTAGSPGALYTPELLQDTSFNPQLGLAHWVKSSGENAAIYSSPTAVDSDYVETNAAAAGDAIWQTVATRPVKRHSYQAQVEVRSATGRPIRTKVHLMAGATGMSTQTATTDITVNSKKWKTVLVTLDVARSGYRELTLGINLITVNADLDIEAPTLQDAGLANAGFANGLRSWAVTGANASIYRSSGAASGSYLETNRTSSSGRVYQTVATTPVVGHSYRAEAWVRSPTGRRAPFTLALAALGARKERATTSAVISSTSWVLVTTDLDIARSGHDALRVSVDPGSSRNVDVEATSLHDAGLENASFEHSGLPDWALTTGQNAAVYSGDIEDAHFLQANTGSAGAGASMWQDVPGTIVDGDSYRGAIDLRSASPGPVSVTVALWALNPSQADGAQAGEPGSEGASTAVTLDSGALTRVPVDLDVEEPGYTTLRLQVYLYTPGANVELDAAEVSQPPAPSGLDPLRSAIVSTAESQDQDNAAVVDVPSDSECNPYTGYWDVPDVPTCGSGAWGGRYSGTWEDESWCASFAAWVWRQAGVSFSWGWGNDQINPWSYTFYEWGQDNGTLTTSDPQPGDAILWGSVAQAYGQHVGIIVGVQGKDVDVVSGNWSNRVWYMTVNPSKFTVEGYPVIGFISPEALYADSSYALPVGTRQAAPELSSSSASPVRSHTRQPSLTQSELTKKIAEQKAP